MSDKIDIVSTSLIKQFNFVTSRETDIIYFYNGKIYDSKNSLSMIKEQTEIQILNCTVKDSTL